MRQWFRIVCGVIVLAGLLAGIDRSGPSAAAAASTAVPRPAELDKYVRDERALVALGKALFWDVQLSSDSSVACASCHFHAGADHRLYNQLSGNAAAAPRRLAEADFPFSRAAMDAGNRASSAGIHARQFAGVGSRGLPDEAVSASAGTSDRARFRQVVSRNAPSVINAALYFRGFWDGRASNTFNGRTPYGDDDTSAVVLVDDGGELTARRIRIADASLASQAVEPPLEAREMSYAGRTWPLVGKRMLALRPLARQRVAPDDSVLAPYVKGGGSGLSSDLTYRALVSAAFRPEYWSSGSSVDSDGRTLGRRAPSTSSEFSQAEFNFSLFFGLAIQAYESTLISDDTPYDRYSAGQSEALSPVERNGLVMFRRNRCGTCHVEPQLTLAIPAVVRGANGGRALGEDAGFFNTGVEPVQNDPGMGARNPLGNFLSSTARNRPTLVTWMQGTFKTPNLRNVELTGPYFHTGSKSTLEQVIDFYTFGGDYAAGSLVAWGPDPTERVAMPALLKAMTDERVRFERAPFDHPELCVPDSQEGQERWALIPAVGASGNRVPLQTFDELLRGIGRDGSRAHNLAESCPGQQPARANR